MSAPNAPGASNALSAPNAPFGSQRSGADAALTGTHVRRFVVRLVAAILAGVGLLLGAVFAIVGAGADESGLLPVGLGALAIGLLCLLVVVVVSLRARGAGERERAARSARASAHVEDVQLKPYTRIGSLVTMTVTVRFRPETGLDERTFARTLHVAPGTRIVPGRALAIAYDPAAPGDFVPLLP